MPKYVLRKILQQHLKETVQYLLYPFVKVFSLLTSIVPVHTRQGRDRRKRGGCDSLPTMLLIAGLTQ